MIVPVILGILLCICFSALFSAAEMSYSSCSEQRLENALKNGDRRAEGALRIVRNFEETLSAILIGNNFANIACSSLTSVLILLLTGSDKYAWIGTAAVTVAVIICGETIPKIVAKKNANTLALYFAGFQNLLTKILSPLVRLTVFLLRILIARVPATDEKRNAEETVDELQSIIETAEDEGILDEQSSDLMQAVIDFRETPVSEVMTARVDMMAFDIDEDPLDILKEACASPYSRFPVYEESIDHIAGILRLDDLLELIDGQQRQEEKKDDRTGAFRRTVNGLQEDRTQEDRTQEDRTQEDRTQEDRTQEDRTQEDGTQGAGTQEDRRQSVDIKSILLKPVYVYRTMKLPLVLRRMRSARQHMAIVTDEYGGTLGVVTMEDVLEQIVGEIWDEKDTVEEEILKVGESDFVLDGDLPVSDFLELTGIREEEFDFESDTLGGWVIEYLNHFPDRGERFAYKGFLFEVLEAETLRAGKIRVCKNTEVC